MAALALMLNGQAVELAEPLTVAEAIEHFGFGGRKRPPAVWINGQSVLLADYSRRRLAEGDQVKMIRIFGGG